MWFQVSEKEARDKVGQALRDAIKIVRGPASRRKASDAGVVEDSPIQKRKKIRTSVDVPPSLKPTNQPFDNTSLKMALGNRRFDQASGNANSTRSLLENPSLGAAFPMSSGGLRGWGADDPDGTNMKSMLESVIEPLDSFTGQQNIDLTKLNNIKRRLSLNQDPFGTASANLLDGQMEQQMEQLAQKRALSQMFGNADFGSTLPSMGALRRLSLLGDQFFGGGGSGGGGDGSGQQAANFQQHQNAAGGLFGLSSLGGMVDFNNGAFSMQQQQQQSHHQATPTAAVAPTQSQSTWDLEPTPLSGSRQK